MDAFAASPMGRSRARYLIRGGSILGMGLVIVAGLLLVIRRVSGAFDRELSIVLAGITAVLILAIVVGGRYAWRAVTPANQRVDQALGWGGSTAVLLMAAGCLPSNAGSSHWLLWGTALLLDLLSRRQFFPGREPVKSLKLRPIAETTVIDLDGFGPQGAPTEDLLLQRLTRSRDENGVESIHGTLRAEFAAGQRHAILHVGFCPPLASLPDVDAECADGPDAVVKVVRAFAHGARLEVKLDEEARRSCIVLVEISAHPSSAALVS